MRTLTTVCLAMMLALCAAPGRAEMATRRYGNPPAGTAVKGPQAAAPLPVGYAPEVKAAPELDGKLTDACWADAPAMQIGSTLDGSGRAAQPADVRAVRKNGVLYLAIHCVEPSTDKIKAPRRAHDEGVWQDDSVEIFIGVGGTYYQFGVNAAGSTYDGQAKDSAWNSGLKAAAAKGTGEWTAEVSIPIESMTGKGKEIPAECTANFNRNRQAGGAAEESAWSPTLSGNSHVPERFGKLLFQSPPEKKPEAAAEKGEKRPVMGFRGAEGRYIIWFDISDLPKDVKIYRANLLIFRTAQITGNDDAANVDIEICPIEENVGQRPGPGDLPPIAAGKPLELRPPWFDRFDVTEAVRASAKSGKLFLFVNVCPFIDAAATCLDVAYEGKPANVPQQATDVKAFHRAGQTFITWTEIADTVATDDIEWGQLRGIRDNLDRTSRVRYCVYRAAKPITAANLHEAELIATVAPLSCWNINGRNCDKPIDDALANQYVLNWHQWNPFSKASADGEWGVKCAMERLVIREGDPPLARTAGLYVHSPAEKGKAYYAVVTSIDGVQNTADITDKNSLAAALDEAPGAGEPVLQKVFPPKPYFNYHEKRLHYVRWVAPPLCNLPSQYYNWAVGVPDSHPEKIPVELSLHRDGRSYYRTQYRVDQDSLVLAPHDFPLTTWWYGYHESLGTLKSFRQGVIQNYTERRLLSFIDWAATKWPIDRGRVLVTGAGGGAAGCGALHLGMRQHKVFSLVLSGYGFADYAGEMAALIEVKRAGSIPDQLQGIWGKVEWGLKTDTGQNVWDELNLTRFVRELPAGTTLPLVTITGTGMMEPMRDFYVAMLEKQQPVMARYGVYGGGLLIPVSRTGTWSNMIKLDVSKDQSIPAFHDPGAACLWEQAKEPSGNLVVSDGIKRWWGEFGLGCRWKDIVDQPVRYEITLFWAGSSRVRNPNGDVTIRRIQNLLMRPGHEYRFELRNPAGELLKEGKVTPGENGIFTFRGISFPPEGVRLIIRP